MSTPLAPGQVFCGECGAQNDVRAGRCWLCYSTLPAEDAEIAYAEIVEKPPAPPQASGTVIALQVVAVCIAVLLFLVGIGAFAHDQALGIVYCIVIAPAVLIGIVSFFVANSRGRQASAQGHIQPAEQSPTAKPYAVGLSSFLMSLAATVGAVMVAMAIAVLIAAAMIIALIAQ
jgi:hypothetical protein